MNEKKLLIINPITLEKDEDQEEELEILPSKIVNPPNHIFRKKSMSIKALQIFEKKKSYSIQILNKLEKKEEIAKISCELCRINPLDRTNNEILGLVKVTSHLNYFEQINKKKSHKSERVHERCCALLSYEHLEKGRIVFAYGEKPRKFYIIFRGSVVVLIPKTAEKFIADKDELQREALSKTSYDFSYLLYLKSKKKLRNIDKTPILFNSNIESSPDINPDLEEDSPKISKREKLHNTFKKFSEFVGGVDFMDIPEVEKLFQDGILKYTFYKEIKAGDHFGDLGIIRDKPRSATIICKEDCSFGVLSADEFKGIFAVVERKKFDQKIDFFREFLIRKVNEGDLVKFVYAFEKKKMVRNEVLYREGDKIKEVYLIQKGEVQLYKTNHYVSNHRKREKQDALFKFGRNLPIVDNNQREKRIFLTLLNGEFFGEEEIFEARDMNKYQNLTRKYCVEVTSSKASIYACPIEFFVKFIQERPKFKIKIQKNYISRKTIRDQCLRFASYGECESLLKSVKESESLTEDKGFRKSVDDFSCKLLMNPLKKIGSHGEIHESYGLLRTISNPKMSFHDKVLNKIKQNNEKVEDKSKKRNFLMNEESGNKKLQKQMMDIQIKYAQKNEESKNSSSCYFTMNSWNKQKKEIKLEKDYIDEILTKTARNKLLVAPLSISTRRMSQLSQISMDPDMWTPRSDIN